MTREERLEKLQRNGIRAPRRAEQEAPSRDLGQIAAEPLLSRPVDLVEALPFRGKNYLRLDWSRGEVQAVRPR